MIFPASLRLSEAERNKRGEMQFLCRKLHFPAFQCGSLGLDPTTFITMVFVPFFTCFFGCCPDMPQPYPPAPSVFCFLLFFFFTRENNYMHPIYCVCKLLSVGFQHCLTFAYSKTVYRHCLVAITPKENRNNAVFLLLICRELWN